MATPTEWLNEFQVNTGTAATGGQSDPHIIGLSNGNFLVAWTESSTGTIGGVGDQDIIGKIYNATGGLERDSYRINTTRNADNETDFDIAPTNDGGYIIVYMDNDDDAVNQTSVIWERHGSDGNRDFSQVVATENVAADFLRNPQVSVNQQNNVSTVSYTDDVGADTDISGKTVGPTGALSGEFFMAQNSNDPDRDGDVAVLSGGNFASVYEETDGAVVGIELRVTNSAGGAVASAVQVATNGVDPQVTALLNGNLLVIWTDPTVGNGDIMFRVYSSTGNPVTAAIAGSGGGNNQNEPIAVALQDGDFFIAFDDDTNNTLVGARYNSNGTSDGSSFVIENVGTTQPELGVTGDGRILVTWQQEAGEIMASIWDPRPSTITGEDYDNNPRNFVDTNVFTARLTSSTVTGTNIGDTIHGRNGNDTLNGLGGNDTINGGFGNDLLIGGTGNDTLNGSFGNDRLRGESGADVLSGSFGNDTAEYTGSNAGVNVNLSTGFGQFGHAAGDTLSSIENLTGSSFNDTLQGNTGANTLNGAGGNDVLLGWSGADVIIGGSGQDYATFASSNGGVNVNLADFGENLGAANGASWGVGTGAHAQGDQFNGIENLLGTTFSDTFRGNSAQNTLTSLQGNDSLFGEGGNDSLAGHVGADFMHGGTGIDTAFYGASNAGINVNLLTGNGFGGHAQGDTIAFAGAGISTIEQLYGSNLNDILAGDNQANTITGVSGNDTMFGNGGNDVFVGGAGADAHFGGAGNDTVFYANSGASVNVNLSTGLGSGPGLAFGDTYTSIENVRGSDFNDTITDSSANNFFVGQAGADTFAFGSGGVDTILDFTNNVDTLDLSAYGFASNAAALATATDTGAHIFFNFGGGDTLTLLNFDNIGFLSNDLII